MPPAASLLTPAILSSLRSTPRLPHHTWYYITGATLSALNRPEEIPSVLSYALKNGVGPEDETPPAEKEQLKIARRMREGLVKSAAVIGLPKVNSSNSSLALRSLLNPILRFNRSAKIFPVPDNQRPSLTQSFHTPSSPRPTHNGHPFWPPI